MNSIVTENLLPGTPFYEWDIEGAGDLSIQGFATDISVDKGGTVHFKIDVKSPSTNYRIKIYRLGYYQGNGARLIEDLGDFSGTPQPAIESGSTGLIDCDIWSESASWDIPIDAVSGVYIVKLTRADNNGSSHMVFIVRDDFSNLPILFKTSDATWQAYNNYGGLSFEEGNDVIDKAVKISYNRPFYTRKVDNGKNWLFNSEYPMIRWLERNGYDVSYTTDLDMERDITPITTSNHKVILSVGRDEYWSENERIKIENARDSGVHLAFFSGNEIYWKTRWEDNRTLVCYKTLTMGDIDPTGTWTGTWRSGCQPKWDIDNYNCQPECLLSGQMGFVQSTGSIIVPYDYKNLSFWRDTNIASSTGQTILPYGTLEKWDYYQEKYSDSYPNNRILLSSTSLNGKTHNLSLYQSISDSFVFGAGTTQWSWGLDENHDNSGTTSSIDIQQSTVNLFTDMEIMPETLQIGLVININIDIKPFAPIVNIIQPSCTGYTGTATIIAPYGSGMTYSIDDINYQTGISFILLSAGTYSTTAKNNGGISDPTIFIINSQPEVPETPTVNVVQPTCSNPLGSIEVLTPIGLTYSIDQINYFDFTIFTGLSSGVYYLTVKNINCISSGITITLDPYFNTPVTPNAIITQIDCNNSTGTIEVDTYSIGHEFSINDIDYYTYSIFTGLTIGTYNLTAKNTISGCISESNMITIFNNIPSEPIANVVQPSCVFSGGTIEITSFISGFSYSFNDIDYFETNIFLNVDPGTYNITAKNISNGCISLPTSVSVIAAPPKPTAAIEVVVTSTCPGSPYQLQLTSATGQSPLSLYNLVINGVTYNSVSIGQTFATIETTGPYDFLWSGITPSIENVDFPQSIELGVRFQSESNGYIHGIRFYKGNGNYGNLGIHKGSLWTSSGERIGHLSFTNETAYGWQEALFDTPVPILSNTTYTASYLAPIGRYSIDYYYFVNRYKNDNYLMAIDGVYKYTHNLEGEFPNVISDQYSNYWVDVLFSNVSEISSTYFVNNLTKVTENGGCFNESVDPPLCSVTFITNSTPTQTPTGETLINYNQYDIPVPLTAIGTNLLWYTSSTGGIGSPVAPTPSTEEIGTTNYFVSQTITGCESLRYRIDVVVS